MLWFKSKEQKAQARSQAIRAQALENARKARNSIGEETLDRVREKLIEQQKKPAKSEAELAREQILAMNKDRVVDHLRVMLDR